MLGLSTRTAAGALRLASCRQAIAVLPALRLARYTHAGPAHRTPWVLSADPTPPPRAPAAPAAASPVPVASEAAPEPVSTASTASTRSTPVTPATPAAPATPAPPAAKPGVLALLRLPRAEVRRLASSADAGEREQARSARRLKRVRVLLLLALLLGAPVAWARAQPLFFWADARAPPALRWAACGPWLATRAWDAPSALLKLFAGVPPHAAGAVLLRLAGLVDAAMHEITLRGLNAEELAACAVLDPRLPGTALLLAAVGEGQVAADDLIRVLCEAKESGLDKLETYRLLAGLVPGGLFTFMPRQPGEMRLRLVYLITKGIEPAEGTPAQPKEQTT